MYTTLSITIHDVHTNVTYHISYVQLCTQQQTIFIIMYNIMLHEWYCNITMILIHIVIHEVSVHITTNDVRYQSTLTKVHLITKFVTCHWYVQDRNTMYICYLLCTSHAWMNNIKNKWKLNLLHICTSIISTTTWKNNKV